LHRPLFLLYITFDVAAQRPRFECRFRVGCARSGAIKSLHSKVLLPAALIAAWLGATTLVFYLKSTQLLIGFDGGYILNVAQLRHAAKARATTAAKVGPCLRIWPIESRICPWFGALLARL
jgi:hypothetical protein